MGYQTAVPLASHLFDQRDQVVDDHVVVQCHDPGYVGHRDLVHGHVRSLTGVEQGYVDGAVLRDGGLHNLFGRPWVEGVGCDVQTRAAGRAHLLGDGGQFGCAACCENEAIAAGGEVAGDLCADP